MVSGLFSAVLWVAASVGVATGVALLAGRWIDRSAAFVAVTLLGIFVVAGLAVAGVLAFQDALVATMGLTLSTSFVLVRKIEQPRGRWGARVRARLAMGVPWGTLVVSGFVLAVYLFVQGGLSNFSNPVVIPFRAWSYLYPQGILAAAFSHSGPAHLIGNLVGTLVLGSLAEFAWGHFPRERGATVGDSWHTHPWIRALVVFPTAVVGVGLLTAAFAIGPVIGFSGVVFAFAGFSLVRYPIGTVVAVVVGGGVSTVFNALREPILTATAQPSPPAPPWWANIAIQGHALGFLLGVVLGWYVFVRRSEGPSAIRIWAGVFLYGIQQSLWAVYWFEGNETFVLYRGPGVALLAALALLVTAALTASDRGIFEGLWRSSGSAPGATPAADGGGSDPAPRVTRRTVAIALLVLGLWLLTLPGVGSNVFAAASAEPPDDGVTVGGYTVFYAESVTNEMVAIVNVTVFNQSTTVETSGVIVTNPDRHIWQQAVSTDRLAFSGRVGVDVGGVGWRKTVVAERRGWSATGGPTAYKVWLVAPGGERRLVHRSDPATASATIAHRNVSVAPGEDDFLLSVSRNNSTVGSVAIPAAGNVTRAAGLRFENRDGSVYALRNGTVVEVATKETYE